jgi:hypothetical protein
MKGVVIGLAALFLCQDLPFKPNEEFEIKLNYQFKQRPVRDQNSIHLSESQRDYDRRTSSDLLPYLILNVKMLKLSEEEVKLKIINNLDQRTISKKIETGTIVPIDLGFTADVKDRVNPHEYLLTFLSPKKQELSKIIIHVDEDGSFLVNGEKRGKF